MKTIEESFVDWESSAIGFGYGTGEPYTMEALRKFMVICPADGAYDYEILEKELGGTVFWLLVSILCKADILEYGTSPRFAWLTGEGRRLREFILSKTTQQLVDISCDHDENYIECYPDACNCGPERYQDGVKCRNPFWPGHWS